MINKKNLPNLITISRGFLTLIIIGLFFTLLPSRFILIFIFFNLASFSDYLDGYLARIWQTVSDFGKMFDPLFDKILTLSLFFLLFNFEGMPKLIFLLLFLRELIIDGLKNYLLAKGVVTPAIWSAKLKTITQIIMIEFALLSLLFIDFAWLNKLVYIFGSISVFFAYYSGLTYINKFLIYFKSRV
jgi:CDP-diacylglycerol--glycerol-3-phosphate 3-phosphatidyltransferase